LIEPNTAADIWLSGEILMKFKVALYPSEEGYGISVPSLPGCWSQGATAEEALSNIADAIRDYLAAEVPPEDAAEVREIEVQI
jgi:predicted RNase H-like HicB family nuclease